MELPRLQLWHHPVPNWSAATPQSQEEPQALAPSTMLCAWGCTESKAGLKPESSEAENDEAQGLSPLRPPQQTSACNQQFHCAFVAYRVSEAA